MKNVKITLRPLRGRSAEAYKTIRANLLFCGADKKAIVLTSYGQNEGKTSVAVNLAVALAEIGKSVLLMDADLRKSVLQGRLKAQTKVKGLSHFLSKQEALEEIVYATDISGLSVIFAGHFPTNPAELLNSPLLEEMIGRLRESFDYILIDSPPLGAVIDGAVIAAKCDGAIMVIESGENGRKDELEIKAQIEKTGCPILGAVLNKLNTGGDYYGKYGEYGYEGQEK